MAEALYRKYRPNVFDDVVGQKHVLQTLQNAILSNKISHAYLFCGPRGTGKTTMARILAKACLCTDGKDGKSPTAQPCGKCQDCTEIAEGQHPDVYELDAASRTGVENVREEIISRVQFAATRGKKKIYIIDEVHMLSTAAFNALLKTLEEPPSHVIFILCTTDPQKVPETILSRCQRFDFKPLSTEEIAARLQYVCDCEGVSAQPSALELIAENAQGAMRNALTQLEQMISFSQGEIKEEDVKAGLNQNIDADIEQLLIIVGNRKLPEAFEWVESLCQKGADFNQITNALTQIIRDMYVKAAGGHGNAKVTLEAMQLYSTDRLHRILIVLGDLKQDLKTSVNPRLSFEIALAKITRPESDLTLESLAERMADLEKKMLSIQSVETAPLKVEQDGSHKPAQVMPAYGQQNNNVAVDSTKKSEFAQVDEPKETNNTVSVQPKWAGIKPIPESAPMPKYSGYTEINNKNDDSQSLDENVFTKVNNNNFSFVENSNGFFDTKANDPVYIVTEEKSENSVIDNNTVSEQVTSNKSSLNLADSSVLHKVWQQIFANIKRKQPAYAAFMMTGNPAFDTEHNSIVLEIPLSSSFAIPTLQKPEVSEKIMHEVRAIVGNEVNLTYIAKDINKKSEFNPTFTDGFRQNSQEEPEESVEDTQEEKKEKSPGLTDIKSWLESSGATIIEE